MSLLRDCNEHFDKYLWPTVKQLETTAVLEGQKTAWDDKHAVRLQGWEKCSLKDRAETLDFIVFQCQLLSGTIIAVWAADSTYHGKLRRCCVAIFKQCMDALQAVSKELECIGSQGLSLTTRTRTLSSITELEGLSWRWWRLILAPGFDDTCLPNLDINVQNLRWPLRNSNCYATDPVMLVPRTWKNACLTLPHIILCSLYHVLTGVHDGKFNYDERQILIWVTQCKERIKDWKRRYKDAVLKPHFTTLTNVLDKLSTVFIEEDVEKELDDLQEKLRTIGEALLTASAREVVFRGLSKEMKSLKIGPSPDQSSYKVSVDLRTAVLVLRACWMLTCHYRGKSEAGGPVGGTASDKAHGASSASTPSVVTDGGGAPVSALLPGGGGSGAGNKAHEKEEHESKSTTRTSKAGEKTADRSPVVNFRIPTSVPGQGEPASGKKKKKKARKQTARETGDTGPKELEGPGNEVLTDEKVAPPSLASRWDLGQVQVVLDYYFNKAAADLQTPGVPQAAPPFAATDVRRLFARFYQAWEDHPPNVMTGPLYCAVDDVKDSWEKRAREPGLAEELKALEEELEKGSKLVLSEGRNQEFLDMLRKSLFSADIVPQDEADGDLRMSLRTAVLVAGCLCLVEECIANPETASIGAPEAAGAPVGVVTGGPSVSRVGTSGSEALEGQRPARGTGRAKAPEWQRPQRGRKTR